MRYNVIDCKESDLKDLYDGSALTFQVLLQMTITQKGQLTCLRNMTVK